jgi:hypothetical protein
MKTSRVLFILCLLWGFGMNVSAKGVSKCKHVILIGADGLTSEVIRHNPGRYKNLEALMKEGCWTLASRSVLPSSSAINWATVLMGAGSEMHGSSFLLPIMGDCQLSRMVEKQCLKCRLRSLLWAPDCHKILKWTIR